MGHACNTGCTDAPADRKWHKADSARWRYHRLDKRVIAAVNISHHNDKCRAALASDRLSSTLAGDRAVSPHLALRAVTNEKRGCYPRIEQMLIVAARILLKIYARHRMAFPVQGYPPESDAKDYLA